MAAVAGTGSHDPSAQINLGHLALQSAVGSRPRLGIISALWPLIPRNPNSTIISAASCFRCWTTPGAQHHFSQALTLSAGQPHPLWQIQQAIAHLPLLDDAVDPAALDQYLLTTAQGLHQSVNLTDCLTDLQRGGIEPLFDLNDLSEDDAPVRSAFADIFRLPSMLPWAPPSPGPLRLGVLLHPATKACFRLIAPRPDWPR